MGDLDMLFGGGDEVEFNPAELDQGTQGLIDSNLARGQQSAQSIIDRRKALVDSSPNLINAGNDATSLGMVGTEGLSRAIYNRANQRRGEGLGRIKSGQEMAGLSEHADDQETAIHSQMAREKVKTRNREAVWKAQAANAEARGAVLRNLLGVAGTLAGAALGGPLGAAAVNAVTGAGKGGGDQAAFEVPSAGKLGEDFMGAEKKGRTA